MKTLGATNQLLPIVPSVWLADDSHETTWFAPDHLASAIGETKISKATVVLHPERITNSVVTKSLALRAGFIATLVLSADELLKVFVRARLPVCDMHALAGCERLDLVGPLRLVRIENAGSALGYAQGWQIWLLLAVLGLVLVPVYARRLRSGAWLAPAAVGLQVGGAAGNLLDRILLGGATDMLYVGYGLVWNLADVALAAGTLLATWLLVRASQSLTAG